MRLRNLPKATQIEEKEQEIALFIFFLFFLRGRGTFAL